MGVASVEFVDPREPVAVRLFFYSPSGLLVSVYTYSFLPPPSPLKGKKMTAIQFCYYISLEFLAL